MRTKLVAAVVLCCAAIVSSAHGQGASITLGEVETAAGEPVAGAMAMIVRTDRGISCNFLTTDLVPGNAYSIWVKIEEPDNDTFIFNVAGGVANANGELSLGTHVTIGTVGPANGLNIIVGGGEFDHPRDATISLLVRSHGPMIRGMQREQFNFLNGGCGPGEPNEGMCGLAQVVVY